MKVTSFQRTSPQNHPNDTIFMNALHLGLYWPSACASLTDFPTSSAFCLHVGFPGCTTCRVPTWYDMIWWTILTCTQKLTRSQL